MASLATHNLLHISVCSLSTVQLMIRLRRAEACTYKNSPTAPICKVTANTKAMIMIKQEETGLGEEGLVGPRTAVILVRKRNCLQVEEKSCRCAWWLRVQMLPLAGNSNMLKERGRGWWNVRCWWEKKKIFVLLFLHHACNYSSCLTELSYLIFRACYHTLQVF